MTGSEWHVIGVEATSEVSGHSEYIRGKPLAGPARWDSGRIVEFRWRSSSQRERGRELEAAGFAPVGSHRDFFTAQALSEGKPERLARVYVPRTRGNGSFPAIGLWRQSGRAFELRSQVHSVWRLERDLERFTPVDTDSWILALEPTLASSADAVEVVRRGSKADGAPLYTREGSLFGPNIQLKFTEPKLYRKLVRKSLREAAGPLPLIRRNGQVTLSAGRLSIHASGGRLRATTHGYGQLWQAGGDDRQQRSGRLPYPSPLRHPLR